MDRSQWTKIGEVYNQHSIEKAEKKEERRAV